MRILIAALIFFVSSTTFSQEKCGTVLFSDLELILQIANGNRSNPPADPVILQEHGVELLKANLNALLHEKWSTFGHLPKVERDRLMGIYRPFKVKEDLAAGILKVVVTPEATLQTTPLSLYRVQLKRGNWVDMDFRIQSDGRISLLADSFKFRQAKQMKYRGFAESERGRLNFDVGELVLQSLPQEVQLSRSMNETERMLWLEGRNESLGSAGFNHKVHFAYKFYEFFGESPYIVKLPKEVLVKLYNEKALELNSYEVKENNSFFGMPHFAQTTFGLNFELVFFREAIPQIQPYLAEHLRQGILPFGPDKNH